MQNQFGNMRLIKLGDKWQLGNWRFMVSANSILTDEQQIAKKVAETIKNFPDPTKIPEKAFCSNTADMLVDKLTQIIIPSSVTSIGDGAFSGHGNLTQIIIPSSVTSIGDSAFFHCENLREITIPSDVGSIGEHVFMDCRNLEKITFSDPSRVTSIGDGAFSNCWRLTQIIIPSNVNNIGNEAFKNCNSLKELTIPDSVDNIDENAFCDCDSLKVIKISQSLLNTIGKSNIYQKLGLNSNVKILDLDGRELVSLKTEVPPQESQDKGCIIC